MEKAKGIQNSVASNKIWIYELHHTTILLHGAGAEIRVQDS